MMGESFPILSSEGEVKYHSLEPALLASIEPLALQHDRYFDIGSTARYIPVPSLVFSRARPEGIVHANLLMREAAAGRGSRRAPIRVRSLDDGHFYVIDGNSTAVNALLSGWPDIPAEVEDS